MPKRKWKPTKRNSVWETRFEPGIHPCPTPHKRAYGQKQAAKRAARETPNNAVRAYRCPCGAWHVGKRVTTNREDERRLHEPRNG